MEKKEIIKELHKKMDEADKYKRHNDTMKGIAYQQNQEIKKLKQQLEDLDIKYRDVMKDHTELLYRANRLLEAF